MSLGSNSDDSNFDRRSILQEASEIMVVRGLEKAQAIRIAEELNHERAEAERANHVQRDDAGHVTAYIEDRLNRKKLSSSDQAKAATLFDQLCEEKGLTGIE